MINLEAVGISVRIANKLVCENLCLRLELGETWGLLGANGVGKTTLLHTLAGLRPPHRGTLRMGGQRLDELGRGPIARRIGVLFQEYSDPFPASVLETALIGRHPYLGSWRWEDDDDLQRAHEALKAVELSGLEARDVNTLSGGERRRLAIATLLTQDPPFMLLDEPTNHLDLRHQIKILDRLRDAARTGQRGLLITLHDLNLAQRYCDRVLLLFGDGSSSQGNAEEILTCENLERLYGHPVLRYEVPQGTVFLPGV